MKKILVKYQPFSYVKIVKITDKHLKVLRTKLENPISTSLKKTHVDERVDVFTYKSQNPGNLAGFQDFIIYKISFSSISTYEENPGKLAAFSIRQSCKLAKNHLKIYVHR